jgi:hypothetical protein
LSEEIQVNDKDPLFETKLGCALLLSYKKEISSIITSLDVQEKRINKDKIMAKFFMLKCL